MSDDSCDVVVVGAGFGGLATALTLARAGVRVTLCETLAYPGGCASTFTRGGARFESGATLFSGFGEGDLFARWVDELGLDVRFHTLDPSVVLRSPNLDLAVSPHRETFIARLAALPGADADALRAFFAAQKRLADVLWELFARPELLPPFGPGALVEHMRRLPRYLPLLGVVGRSLLDVVSRYGLAGFRPLRTYLDAVSQITVQASAAEAEAPFALATMDYYFRGTGHVEGGIGKLAWELARAVERHGGRVRFADRVKGIRRLPGGGFEVDTRRGRLRAPVVVGNLVPHRLRALAGLEVGDSPRLDRLARRVEGGWGAVMLYLVVHPDAPEHDAAHHMELVLDETAPFLEGNHVFVSVSGKDEHDRAPDSRRTVTVSTHVAADALRRLPEDARASKVAAIHAHMRRALAALAPSLSRGVEHEMTGSPRTFERFTGRDFGFVGGIPRRVGLANYLGAWPRPVLPGLYLVGDSVFPGQSTLATAIGGLKLADRLLASSAIARQRRGDASDAEPTVRSAGTRRRGLARSGRV